MGITVEIRKQLKEQFATRAWLSSFPSRSTGSRGRARLYDSLNNMHELAQSPYAGPRILGQFTSRDLVKKFIEPVTKFFIQGIGDTNVVVLILDDDAYTPKEKLQEQQRRTKDKAMYPSDVEFVDEGVKISVPISANESVKQVDLIDFAKVMANRVVRKKMWQYFLKSLQSVTFPRNCTFIYSFDRSGPWMWHDGKSAVHMPQWAHNFGEFDVAVPFWLWLLRDYDIVIDCKDTDIIPICISYLSSAPTNCIPKSIVWSHMQSIDGKKYPQLVDMKILMEDALHSTGMTAQQFIMACVLAGTDFYNKQWISGYFNEGLIFEVIASGKEYLYQEIMNTCLPPVGERETQEQQEGRIEKGMEKLRLYVRTLFTLLWVNHKDTPANRKVLIDEQKLILASENNRNKRKREKEEQEEEKNYKYMKFTTTTTTTSNTYKTKENIRPTEENKIWEETYIKSRLDTKKKPSTSKKVVAAVDDVAVNASASGTKGLRFPTEENLALAFERLQFNLEYWLRSWQKNTFYHPNEGATKVPGLNA